MAGAANGNVVMAMSELALCIFLYGMYIPIGLSCFCHLISSRNRNRNRLRYFILQWMYFIISIIFATSFMASYLVSIGKELFCISTVPQEFKLNCGDISKDYQLFIIKQMSLTAFKLNLLCADALSLYRLMVVWRDYRMVVVVPVLLYLASLTINFYSMFTPFVVPWGISQAGIIAAVSFDLTCTALIASRLLIRRKKTRNVTVDFKNTYATLSTILIESSMLNAVTRQIYTATGGTNKDGTLSWPALLAASGAIFAPTFIIIRLQIHVKSEPDRQQPHISTIRFANGTRGLSSATSGSEADHESYLSYTAPETAQFHASVTDERQSGVEEKIVTLESCVNKPKSLSIV